MVTPKISSIRIHPLKSGRALDASEAVVEPWGLAGDRRWMLVRPDGRHLSQREDPRLGRFHAAPSPDGGLTVDLVDPLGTLGTPPKPLQVAAPSPEQGRPLVPVRVHSSPTEATEAAPEAHAWFRGLLGEDVRLVHMDDPRRRLADPVYAGPGRPVSFADGYPLLVTTAASLAALNEAIGGDHPEDPEREAKGAAVPMARFRPNLVVDGTGPWAEDGWRRIRVGGPDGVVFRVVKPCERCVMTTTDQETGERRGPEPLRALARHHRLAGALIFGQNLVPEPADGGAPGSGPIGTVRLGDAVEVLETAEGD
jgi:uncharacterized protein YcbX